MKFYGIDTENNKKSNEFSAYYNNNLSVNPSKTNSTENHSLLVIPQIALTLNSNFIPAKDSSYREKVPYICGLRARIGCEPVSEHSTRSDRVTNIGYLLSVGASVLSTTNYYLLYKFLYITLLV